MSRLIAAFTVPYMPKPAVVSNSENGGPSMRSPATDVIMSTHPCLRSRIAGSASWVRCSGASTCISNIRRARFSGNSSSGRRNVTAALLTRMSGDPTCAITSAIIRSRSSLLDRSAWTATAVPPAAAISSHVSRREPTYFGSGSRVRAVMATVAPFGGEALGDRLAQPAAAPGDERDLALTVPWHAAAILTLPASSSTRVRPPGAPDATRGRRRPPPRRRRLEPDVRRHDGRRPARSSSRSRPPGWRRS